MRLITFVLLYSVAFAASADEQRERDQIKLNSATLFEQGEYREIDRIAASFAESGSRTSSGTSKLHLVHIGIASPAESFDKNDDAAWRSQLDKANEWIAMSPDSPTAHLVRAYVFGQRAWQFRGTRFIKDTPKADLDAAGDLMTANVKYLLETKGIAAVHPDWYYQMLAAYTYFGAPGEEYERLLAEAIEEHPDFDEFYFHATFYYSPQYGGSSKEIDDLALLALRNTQSRRGHEMYARVYWAAPALPDGKLHLMGDEINWEYFRKGIDDLIAKYPTQWNINHLAFFACMGQDYEKTFQLMSKIEPPAIDSAWRHPRNLELCQVLGQRWNERH